MTEQAAEINCASVVEQLLAHAARYPALRHLCPRCRRPIAGAELAAHWCAHLDDAQAIDLMMAL